MKINNKNSRKMKKKTHEKWKKKTHGGKCKNRTKEIEKLSRNWKK